GAAYGPNIVTTAKFAFDDGAVAVVTVTNGSVQPTAPRNLTALKAIDLTRYGQAIGAIGEIPCVMPPSSSVAGVYVLTDTTRGVWKAPANAALNLVTQPAIQVGATLQDEMNVSVTGKSVNGIRQFPGRGTLVWGATTLDGNSTDWRYVSVRRFMTFVESSVRIATQPFVFEANDARTWSSVQAMIENFLQSLWRQGALIGNKPEHAFFVQVGLGKTMTAQDILDGRLNVVIGVAVVRPAEFVVLTISLKMTAAS
ncbi:MAG: phage tail sheath C-terminal domain-containing protein, partial [Gemmatimonadaceae bacterium]